MRSLSELCLLVGGLSLCGVPCAAPVLMLCVPSDAPVIDFGATPVAQGRGSFHRIIGMSCHHCALFLFFFFLTRCVHLFVGRCSTTSGCHMSMEFNSGGSADFQRTFFAFGGVHDPSCDQLSHDCTALLHELRLCQVVRFRRVGT